jgi:V/A-type H+-transporting ATPase subunit I
MLRPERMSRVSVTGAQRVMADVIETVHQLNLLHVTEYGDDWAGFEPGDPRAGADAVAEKLVTVRALESTLDVTEDEAGPGAQIVTDEALEDQLEQIRQEVNEADDRRNELRSELRSVEERIDTMEPFVRLGIDIDLLRGYDTLTIEVGEGDVESVRTVLRESDIEDYETFASEGVVAVAARGEADTVQDTLVNATFSAIEVPDGEGDPESYLSELRHRKQQLEAKLSTVEEDLEDLRLDYGGFLLAAEETLTIQVDKLEAPLAFATTANAFIAEGWIPSERYDEFEAALRDAVGDHVEISELERASYDEHGHIHDHEDLGGGEGQDADEGPTAAAAGPAADAEGGGDEAVATDGGSVTMGAESPPVIMDNPDPVKPFEALTEIINRPKYTEFDPSVILFLTFPAFFGFMIGDVGYGLLYVLLGAWLVRGFESDVVRSLGGVALWAGGFTTLFGLLYGEIFGLHLVATYLWEGALGLHGPPMHKGLQPADVAYAQTWLIVSLLAGMVHLLAGYVIDFAKTIRHGLVDAVTESGSWILMMGGLWAFVFSSVAAGAKPRFLFTVFGGEGLAIPGAGEPTEAIEVAYGLGFTGLPEVVGWLGLAAFGVGLVLLAMGDIIEVVEFLNVLVNVLSYTRLAAVLLAKAGMAFVVNLLFFGVYVTGEGSHATWHFGLGGVPEVGAMVHGHEVTEIMFGGLMHSGIAGLLVGILVLVIGHMIVLGLGITSAGLQAVRLEYVEFFGKFFEGGGTAYLPFGQERQYTAD